MRTALGAPDRGGNAVRASLLAAIAAAVALAVYGLVRYPGLREDAGTWLALATFLGIALVYVAAALSLSRGRTPAAAIARGFGCAGGLVVGAGWLLIVAPVSKTFVFVPLALALTAPVATAALAGRASGDAPTGRAAALWSGLVGGLCAFIILAVVAYSGDGRPYDPQLIRDFQASGSHDLAAYAVGDSLGGALGMLLVIPVVALALGSLASAWTAATRRAPQRR
ncbi:MAG TPA: hypothetical protein VFD90_08720 [Gaiellales bacterium]|nr:hypothetical protein [Gaiellales bacterium]